MDNKTAALLIRSLISRMVEAGKESWQLEGSISSVEYDALRYVAELALPPILDDVLGGGRESH